MAKVEATKGYGAEVGMVGQGIEEAIADARKLSEETGAGSSTRSRTTVVAGQGTIGLELAEQVAEAETVLVPIGGGGLAAGIGLALRACCRGDGGRRPRRRAGDGFALADGIAVKEPGELTGPLLDEVLDDVVEVSPERDRAGDRAPARAHEAPRRGGRGGRRRRAARRDRSPATGRWLSFSPAATSTPAH